jgi:hypothetical protein
MSWPVAKVPNSFLAALPRQRDVVSFRHGADAKGRYALLKFRLRDGAEEVIVLPPAVAFHVRDSARKSIETLRYRDVRRRVGDSRPEMPDIRRFLDGQPDLFPGDWDGKGNQRVAYACEVSAFSDALFLAFGIGDQKLSIYKSLRLPPVLSFYLVAMISELERDRAIVDLSKATSPSTEKN